MSDDAPGDQVDPVQGEIGQALSGSDLRALKAIVRAHGPQSVLDYRDPATGHAALHRIACTARGASAAMARYLLDLGANVDAPDPGGRTPLQLSVEHQGPESEAVRDVLLSAGPDVHAVDNRGRTALHRGAFFGEARLVRQLLAHGCEVNRPCARGCTALNYAARMGRVEIVTALLEAGANPTVPDANGDGPLHAAAAQPSTTTLEVLLAHPKSAVALDLRDSSGCTALYIAADSGAMGTAAVRVLLAAGADPGIATQEGALPEHAAEMRGIHSLARELRAQRLRNALTPGPGPGTVSDTDDAPSL